MSSPSAKLLKFLSETIPHLAQCPEIDPVDLEWFRQFTERLLMEAATAKEANASAERPAA